MELIFDAEWQNQTDGFQTDSIEMGAIQLYIAYRQNTQFMDILVNFSLLTHTPHLI